MTSAERYRSLAATLRERIRDTDSPSLASEWQYLAECYTRLAAQAERNEALGPEPQGDSSAAGTAPPRPSPPKH